MPAPVTSLTLSMSSSYQSLFQMYPAADRTPSEYSQPEWSWGCQQDIAVIHQCSLLFGQKHISVWPRLAAHQQVESAGSKFVTERNKEAPSPCFSQLRKHAQEGTHNINKNQSCINQFLGTKCRKTNQYLPHHARYLMIFTPTLSVCY